MPRHATPASAALFLLSLASCQAGPTHCDDPANTCGQPPAHTGITIRSMRENRYPADAGVPVQSVVVTAVDTYDEDMRGHVGNVWVQETSPNGTATDRFAPCPMLPNNLGRACALQLFQSSYAPTGFHPAVGDIVSLSGGGYQEFNCGTCTAQFTMGHYIPEVSRAVVSAEGVAPPPPPIVVTIADLEAHYDQLVNVLVEIDDVTAVDMADARLEILIGNDPRNGLHITQQLTPIRNVVAGTHWERVIGIASYFYSPKIEPRSPADLVNPTMLGTPPPADAGATDAAATDAAATDAAATDAAEAGM